MSTFKLLSEDELHKLSSKERREYLRQKKEYDNKKLLSNIMESDEEDQIKIDKKETPSKEDEKESSGSKTTKEIVDIDIELIDTDELNEQMFGYEDLKLIEESFNTIGNNSVIYVYKRANGRYLCYAGNQRLIATKNRGEKTITCIITGDEPTKADRIERLIFMNAQRKPRPYYIAQQLAEYEKLLRSQGKTNINALIEEKFGYKKAMQKRYQQILKLELSLQMLFKNEDVPFAFLLEKCLKLPEGKEDDFANEINELYNESEETGITTQLISKAYAKVTGTGKEDVNENLQKPLKASQAFKELVSMPYTPDVRITIPEQKKTVILAQAKQMKEYLEMIIESCEA